MITTTKPERPSFEEACARFVNRFTMEYVPPWAHIATTSDPEADAEGLQTVWYPAPHYRTDREWYDNTKFWGEDVLATRHYCFSSGQTWPCGIRLHTPYKKA